MCLPLSESQRGALFHLKTLEKFERLFEPVNMRFFVSLRELLRRQVCKGCAIAAARPPPEKRSSAFVVSAA